ncbi:putative quinol monooxygenase [Microbispora bryophytorum]|uniref:Antibiotic biosynthesis monooxygenase n=1 Tax=Microbispora bryophytorum subsp. camponoti TaxID=1677852 RepID=A0ABR8L219_9ACTN|nr:antibiotic biosynthesis monooxygenase [Microbispora camponoti]MBD3143764.1 antibiotic biosynthesis monooxygenase [Microbispora camponoti]
MFGLVVRFTCKDEATAETFDQLIGETIEGIKAHEPGTLVYTVHKVDGEPLLRIFYELYRDRAAFDAHEEQEHTKRFFGARDDLISGFEIDWLDLQVGKVTTP